ncbi:hypothetical protein P171DRAFT_200587 [Karstenula rhodostoma CBS 690.94]|uniref:Uncharacterized protein n=1 Tax=Karstenula rhodostoma CBS 690.94 TaxID=1392251 RepID=A0A9P4PV88_9PLEO|nr:hypothetical protein P171DRAFT_200587 [Karstenula rhodostoma CBS 690.94]
MSSPADFWASKIGQLRGVYPPSPELKKKPSGPGAPNKTGGSPVFKAPQKDSGLSSPAYTSYDSTSPVTPSTATSWADSVEEDEAEAASYGYGVGQKSHEYTLMASTVARQAKRLEETESTVDQQAQRIVELNTETKGQAFRIEQLEVAIDEKSARLVELEASTVDQEARIANLVHQVDKEARRATRLAEELEKKAAIIQQLELQIAENVSMPDSDSATEVEVDDGSVAATPQPKPEAFPAVAEFGKIDAPAVDPKDTTAGAIGVTPEKPAKSQAASPVDGDFPALSPTEFPALGKPTPVRDLRRSPFVTADNIRKMPPPPPARTLKFGIDPSKFQKKPASGPGKFIFGSRRATEGPPKIDLNKDIRHMSKEEREPFGYGPTAQIVMGNETVAALPKYIFMQVSYTAFKHWTENPTAQTIKFEAGSMTKGALNIQLDWITMHTHCNYVFSISLNKDNSDRHNLELIRCARVLGLHSMYMGHFTRLYCQKVRDGPSKELVALVEELAYNDDDPIFDCLANWLAMQRSKVKSEHIGSWDEELARLPKLARKMQEVQARKNFALGKTHTKEKVLPQTKAAEEFPATTVTAGADSDPDAAWRVSGPAYV